MADTDTPNEIGEFIKKIENEMFKPNVPVDMAIELVSRHYGLEVTEIKPMNSFSDQNFFIKVSKDHRNPYIDQVSDQGYTFKIMNTFKSNIEKHFDSLHEGMIHLYNKGLRVPQPIRNVEGKTWKLEVVPLQEKAIKPEKEFKCGIHLLSYIPGVPVATFKNTEDNFFEWGVLLAKFHNALKDLDCPALKSKVIFSDVKYFAFVKGFIENLEEGKFDEEVKGLVQNVTERYPTEIAVHLDDLPHGFVHGDFNDHNILAQLNSAEVSETSYTADGILDFDDMHYGSYAWDLGLMLGHVLLQETKLDPLEAAGHAVAGYRSIRHLNELEMFILKVCMECRISMTSLISAFADDDPNNSYVKMLATLEPKRNMLKRLANTKSEDVLHLWDSIMKKRGFNEK